MTERFVRAIVLGGLALLAGLWTVELASLAWVWWAGVALAALGALGLAWGIGTELR